MPRCKECKFWKWGNLAPKGGDWVICKCTKFNLIFGLESDVNRNKDDPQRGISAMPEKCRGFEERMNG